MRIVLGVATCAVVVFAVGVCEAGSAEKGSPRGYVLERAAEIAEPAPGPHDGLGQTTGSRFFGSVTGVPFAFTRRALHPGSSIGIHEQHEDEIYFVVSGTGRMTIDGDSFDVRAGDAVLTRPGSTHGLIQSGGDDLVIIIVYPRASP
jgi:mannose-6-phosphate isomerase-like protein (cupin superfamily)